MEVPINSNSAMISPNCAFPTLNVSKNGIIEVMEELEISIYKK